MIPRIYINKEPDLTEFQLFNVVELDYHKDEEQIFRINDFKYNKFQVVVVTIKKILKNLDKFLKILEDYAENILWIIVFYYDVILKEAILSRVVLHKGDLKAVGLVKDANVNINLFGKYTNYLRSCGKGLSGVTPSVVQEVRRNHYLLNKEILNPNYKLGYRWQMEYVYLMSGYRVEFDIADYEGLYGMNGYEPQIDDIVQDITTVSCWEIFNKIRYEYCYKLRSKFKYKIRDIYRILNEFQGNEWSLLLVANELGKYLGKMNRGVLH